MRQEEIREKLGLHRQELEARGVTSLALFGSAARGEVGTGSDVDLLVEFDRPLGLFGFLEVKEFLEAVLGCEVDLVTPRALKRQLRQRILREAVRAL